MQKCKEGRRSSEFRRERNKRSKRGRTDLLDGSSLKVVHVICLVLPRDQSAVLVSFFECLPNCSISSHAVRTADSAQAINRSSAAVGLFLVIWHIGPSARDASISVGEFIVFGFPIFKHGIDARVREVYEVARFFLRKNEVSLSCM